MGGLAGRRGETSNHRSKGLYNLLSSCPSPSAERVDVHEGSRAKRECLALPLQAAWLRVSNRGSWGPCGAAAGARPLGRLRRLACGLSDCPRCQTLLLLLDSRDATVDAGAQPLQAVSQEAVPAVSESRHLFSHFTPPSFVSGAGAGCPGYDSQLTAEATASLRAKL